MAKKNSIQTRDFPQALKFVEGFIQDEALKKITSFVQDYAVTCTYLPDITQQKIDLQLNLSTLNKHPLARLQLLRLVQQSNKTTNVTDLFATFIKISEEYICVSSSSAAIVDPYYKNDFQFSSNLHTYKKWLLKLIFLWLFYVEKTLENDLIEMKKYFLWVNQIYYAVTSSRVSLRKTPDMTSEILIDLPKNSSLQMFAQAVQQHWVKVHYFLDEHTTLEGYIQKVYLKTSR